MKTNLYPEGFYISPAFAMDRLEGMFQKHGQVATLRKSRFKPEREAWISGVFGLGLHRLTGKEYWIGINPEDTTPDTTLATFEKGEKGTKRLTLNLEIFEWEEHSTSTLEEAIKQKLSNKNYPSFFVLLCYVHGHSGENADLPKLLEALKAQNPSVMEIWIAGSIQSDGNDHAIVRVYPEPAMVAFRLQEERAKNKIAQGEMLKTERGRDDGQKVYMGMRRLRLPD